MATGYAFEKRLDEMYKYETPRSRKRGRWTTSSPRIGGGGYGETKLLRHIEKRVRVHGLMESKNSLFPTAALPTLTTAVVHHGNGNIVPFRPPFPILQLPPKRGVAVTSISRNSAFADPGTPAAITQLEVYRRDALPASSSALVSEDFLPIAREDVSRANGLLDAKDKEITFLRSHLIAMESRERERAKELKSNMELEAFKAQVMARTEWSRDRSKPWLEQMHADRANAPRGVNSISGEPSRVTSSSAYPAVDMGGSSGALSSDEENASAEVGGVGGPQWKSLYNSANSPTKAELRDSRQKEIEYTLARLEALQIGRTTNAKVEEKPEDQALIGAFTPLTDSEEADVENALRGYPRHELLATHERSNIDITRGDIQCLLPGTWLNDEVINVYMELLKERESSDPDRFLKCHFFNTFFYNKLFKDKRSYDYKAVRRWTTQKKLGYSLNDCHKILVPIHQDIHWCLAVINIRDKKLEYLDSLKGQDIAVLDVLAKYVADEAKDKDGKVLDTSDWPHVSPKDIPEQLNGCDCGMFMVKYADFHSRDAPLSFGQENMEYFRRKMVSEILHLKAT